MPRTKNKNIKVLCEYVLDNRNKCTTRRYIVLYYSIMYREFYENL